MVYNMVRKIILVLTVIATCSIFTGCDDKPTAVLHGKEPSEDVSIYPVDMKYKLVYDLDTNIIYKSYDGGHDAEDFYIPYISENGCFLKYDNGYAVELRPWEDSPNDDKQED